MSNPLVHAERSARQWGGAPDDYLAVHRWFDATKGCLCDNRHRMVLHNAFGILLCEQVFGAALTNSAGRRVFLRDIGVQHIVEDLGCVPTLAECLAELPFRPWMGGARLARPQPDETGLGSAAAEESGGEFSSDRPHARGAGFAGRVAPCNAWGRHPGDQFVRQSVEQDHRQQEP